LAGDADAGEADDGGADGGDAGDSSAAAQAPDPTDDVPATDT
jgi:hypothetical protein